VKISSAVFDCVLRQISEAIEVDRPNDVGIWQSHPVPACNFLENTAVLE